MLHIPGTFWGGSYNRDDSNDNILGSILGSHISANDRIINKCSQLGISQVHVTGMVNYKGYQEWSFPVATHTGNECGSNEWKW